MLWAVLMAGGSGTRFWPESRKKRPKQFLGIFGQRTLLEDTVRRIAKVIPKSRVIVVTNQEHEALVRRLLKLKASQVIGEPMGRNTAPCAVLAAKKIMAKDPKATIALLPSDHRIGKPARFQKALKVAAKATAESGMPVTFGIHPTHPHTGYGYLERAKRVDKKGGLEIYRLKRFCEKPNLNQAKKYLRTKRFYWNSGMFVWQAKDLLVAAKKHLPRALKVSENICDMPLKKGLKRHFSKMPNISIDYGLMERLRGKILTLPVDLDWHDLGSWQSFDALWPADRQGNVTLGDYLPVESSKNIVKSGKRLIATIGVHDFVIVDTPDALLICPKENTERIREIVAALKQRKLKQYL